MGNWTEMTKWTEKLKSISKNQWFLILLMGILVLVAALPSVPGSEEKKAPEMAEVCENGEENTIENMENRLREILSVMEGAGKVEVMITQKTSGEKVVEKDIPTSASDSREEDEQGNIRTSTENRSEETTVYEKDESGNETPYVTMERAPEIEGVLVLAQGGDNAVVAANITEAVMALFHLDAHKIKVMKMV